MTADGKIATATRSIETFGSRRDHQHLLELRATADAVMCGAETARMPGVVLGPGGETYQRIRRRHGLAEFNIRVVASGRARLTPQAEIFRHRFSPIIILVSRTASHRRVQDLRTLADAVGEFGEAEIDFRAALSWLRECWGIHRLVVEGGATLNESLIRAGLVDELHLTVCPWIFGGRSAPTLADGRGVDRLGDATRLALQSARRVGDESYLVYRVLPNDPPDL